MTSIRSAAQIITTEQLAELRNAGFVVIHREPTEQMAGAFYANKWPEQVVFSEGFHRMVAQSIRDQNER
jgi:hypothetical protein